MESAASIADVPAPNSSRLLSLDAFRGLTILAMILVNNPGSWGHMYWPLGHAKWHGWTPTDLIFPFFLFIVGTALAYSFRKYREGDTIDRAVYWRIVRRTAVLIFLGWLPGLVDRAVNYFSGAESTFELETLRLPGVLVRIAIVYFFVSLIVLHTSVRAQAFLAIVILLGYWALLAFLPNPHDYTANLTREGNVSGLVDRTVLGQNHMWSGDRKTDPEGILSTLPALVTALLGYWTGLFIQRRGVNGRTVALLVVAGIALAAVGQTWHYWFPINKKLWTSSFVLLAGGLAMVVLAGCLMKFDLWGWRRLARPFEIVGINAIFVFVASGLVATWISRWKIGEVSARDWFIETFITSWITDPKAASLGYALAFVALWWLVLWAMARLGWTIRV